MPTRGKKRSFLSIFIPFAVLAYAMVFSMLLGMTFVGAPNPSVSVVESVQKVGVPVVPDECSTALDEATDTISLSKELGYVATLYSKAVKHDHHAKAKKLLAEMRDIRTQLNDSHPQFDATKTSCVTAKPGIRDISTMQPAVNSK